MRLFEYKTFSNEIISRIKQINDHFPFEIKVTREYIIPEMSMSRGRFACHFLLTFQQLSDQFP
jgi:hypothetical protein